MFLNRIKEAMIRFMTGRNGTDKLYYAFLFIYIFLVILGFFIVSPVIVFLTLFVFLCTFFRVFSKNLEKREKENAAFERFLKKIKNGFKLNMNRIRDFREKRYRRCPGCKTVLRLPRKRGHHKVNCPRCKNEFKVRVLF